MQSMAASFSSSSAASSSRAWAAARRSPPSVPSSRHVTFASSPSSSSSSPSSSHGCRWPVAGALRLPLGIRGGLPRPLLAPGVARAGAAARTRAVAAGKPEGAGGIPRTLQLGAMILVWYLLNIYFNVYNKLVLKVVPFPYTITTFHFASGSFFVAPCGCSISIPNRGSPSNRITPLTP